MELKMLQIRHQSAFGIQTKTLGATDTKGARIKASKLGYVTARPDTLTLPYGYSLSGASVHEPAMRKLHDQISHNPDIDRHQQKDCNHVAISTWTDTGYIFTFIDGGNND